MTDTTLKMIIGLLAFFALTIVALGAGSNIYSALFPEDTSTQDLAQRIEFLVCGGGFGHLQQATENGCEPSERYARMIYSVMPDKSNPELDRLVFFSEGEQEMTPGAEPQINYPFKNPLLTPAICRQDINTIQNQGGFTERDCVSLSFQGVDMHTHPIRSRIDDESNWIQRVFNPQYEDYLDFDQTIPAVISPSETGFETPLFLLFIEYTPATHTQEAQLLITPFTEELLEQISPQPEPVRVGVTYSQGSAVDPEGNQRTTRPYCYTGDKWMYQAGTNTWISVDDFRGSPGGYLGHQELTQELTGADYNQGITILEEFSEREGFHVEIPEHPRSIRLACN